MIIFMIYYFQVIVLVYKTSTSNVFFGLTNSTKTKGCLLYYNARQGKANSQICEPETIKYLVFLLKLLIR